MTVLETKRCIIACLLIAIAMNAATGQDNFVAIPPREVNQYHIDFARVFFASPEVEKRDRAQLYAALKELENLKTKVTDSAATLELALQLNDRVQVQFNKH